MPRILAMNDARAANRKNDMELWGTMMATAQHDPKRIPKVIRPRKRGQHTGPEPATAKWWGR